jgi:3-phenylpropionate/trans-cinnamate dioxygenase ferredoxin reductase subunit
MENFDCIIVGSGHGGAQAAHALRHHGFAGSIGLIGAEAELPYDRPSLSKEYLAGEKAFDRLLLRPAAYWDQQRITLLAGRRVTEVSAAQKHLTCADGARFGFGTLIWAAGGAPRQLTCEGNAHPAIHYLRDKADCDRLLAALPDCRHVAIIGGGFIGLEAAAVLRGMGRQVTLIESQERVLSRVAGVEISRFFEAEHRARGVEILLGTGLEAIRGEGAAELHLSDGRVLTADLVIAGIGMVPATEVLRLAGAETSQGVLVDAACQSSLPGIYCIGDCAVRRGGPGIRIESVQNANDQAATAARAICGLPVPEAATPWFWSNQYDLKLQTMGLSLGHDATLLRGDPGLRSFSLLYLRRGAVIAADCINATRDYVQSRQLIEAGSVVPAAVLADTAIPLKAAAGREIALTEGSGVR